MCERPSICHTFEADDALREASYKVAQKKRIFRAAFDDHEAAYGSTQATIQYKKKMNALWDYMSAKQEFYRRVQAYLEVIEEYATELEEKRNARTDSA